MVSLFSKELPFKAKAVFFCKGDVTTSLLVGFAFPTLQRLHRFIWMGLVTICYISTLEALGKCCLPCSISSLSTNLVTRFFSDSTRAMDAREATKRPENCPSTSRTSTLGDDWKTGLKGIYNIHPRKTIIDTQNDGLKVWWLRLNKLWRRHFGYKICWIPRV